MYCLLKLREINWDKGHFIPFVMWDQVLITARRQKYLVLTLESRKGEIMR